MDQRRFAPLPPEAAASLYEGLAGEEDWRLVLPYVPDAHRAGAISILALMREVEGVPARVSEPMLGRIRCQWWRDALDEAFGDGRARAHPLACAIEEALSPRPELSAPLHALVDGAEDALEAGDVTGEQDALDAAARIWGNGAAALAVLLGQGDAASSATRAASAHAVLRLAGRGDRRTGTRSLPRLSDRLSARPRPGDASSLAALGRDAARSVPPGGVAAVLPASLLAGYARGAEPSPLGKRTRYFQAVLRGRA